MGKKLLKQKSSSIIYKTAANVANVYLTNIGKAQYSYLDSMRTLAVNIKPKFILIQPSDQQEHYMQNLIIMVENSGICGHLRVRRFYEVICECVFCTHES